MPIFASFILPMPLPFSIAILPMYFPFSIAIFQRFIFWCNKHLSILIKQSPLKVGPKDVAQYGWTPLSILHLSYTAFYPLFTIKFLQINLCLCTFTNLICFLKWHKLTCLIINKTFHFIFAYSSFLSPMNLYPLP